MSLLPPTSIHQTDEVVSITMGASAATPTSLSPCSCSLPEHDGVDLDTPIAVDPEPESRVHKVILEGIPQHMGSSSTPPTSKAAAAAAQKSASSPPRLSFDNKSYDSLLSSLDEVDELSLEEDEDSFYFSPMEEPPLDRIERLKRELDLRRELLQYLAKGQPAAYVEQLAIQEQAVQQMTLQTAQIKESERLRRRSERRRQRRESLPNSFENSASNTPTSTSESGMAPKSLFPMPSTMSMTPLPVLSLSSYWDFERFHALPAQASFLLACVAHAALYELVLAMVLACIQPFLHCRQIRDADDRIVDLGHQGVEDLCYAAVLFAGLVLARCSGLLFSFDETQNTKPHQDPTRVDRSWAQWLHHSKMGRRVKGCLDVFSFYVCFVAMTYFLGKFAWCVDQRETFFQEMPSSANNSTRTLLPNPNYRVTPETIGNGICPLDVEDILFPTDSSDDDDGEDWDLPQCGDIDDYGNRIIFDAGIEDEAYLFEKLSASAYQQFWGVGHRAAILGLPRQVLYNLTCSVVAIYTLKRYFGCSFWEDW